MMKKIPEDQQDITVSHYETLASKEEDVEAPDALVSQKSDEAVEEEAEMKEQLQDI